jgi:hypothetical protein
MVKMAPDRLSSPKPTLNRRQYLQVLARMGPSLRLCKAFELSDMTKQLLKDGLRRRFPERTEEQLHALYLKRLNRCHNNNC